MDNKKAIIAMSGGVDSSVAALLIKKRNVDCIGITMRLQGDSVDTEQSCCTNKDIEDARRVADTLGIPFLVLNFSDDFSRQVIERFIDAYEKGFTPNPCIYCNRYIKWEKLFSEMKERGYDYVVTGHYARIEYDPDTDLYKLKKGLDESKDQSYVLYNMTQEQLSHTLLPIGELSKTKVRNFAEDNGFINADKPDSQDICFIPDGDYAAFIENRTGKTYPYGEFVDKEGKVLGEHKGLIRYTIGQRKGLGLALKNPGYVCRKCNETNRVIIGDNEDLFTSRLVADDFNWILREPATSVKIKAKTRYKHKEQPAIATVLEDGKVEIVFDEPQRAITEGQAVVLYDGDTVLGGGTIIETEYNI